MNEKNLKQYLKDGYVVVTSDGLYGLIINDAIVFNDGKLFISYYDSELKYSNRDFDIVKILKSAKAFYFTDMVDGKFEHTVVWESELNTEQESKPQNNTKSKNDIDLFSVEIFVKNLDVEFSSIQLKLTHDQFRQLCDQLASPLVQNICVGHSQGLFYINKENISLIHSFSDF